MIIIIDYRHEKETNTNSTADRETPHMDKGQKRVVWYTYILSIE